MRLQIKGISDVLEGLIPYTQRHFSRIDRLVRSTFLLDYTLTGMSVIEPDTEAREVKAESLVDSNVHQDANDVVITENVAKEQIESEGKTASKKRKSHKSRESSHKKVRRADKTNAAVISLQA